MHLADQHSEPDLTTAAPLAPGSVSLRIYPLDLPPAPLVTEIRHEARLAEDAGFDGCMFSEHHGGFPNYLPNPLLAATWALDATERLWAAPCPLLLPLRPVAQVVEDVAWTYHRFPGRIGLGVAAGAIRTDFDLSGVPYEELFPRYRTALATVTQAFGGRASGPLAHDPGVAALRPGAVPIVAAVQTARTAARAGGLGAGTLYDSLQDVTALAPLSAAHAAAGGSGARILIRRAWIGDLPGAAAEAQMARYRGAAAQRQGRQDPTSGWASDGGSIVAGSGAEVAEQIMDAMVRSGSDAVNIRVFLAGLTASEVCDQVARHGEETLPALRRLLPQLSRLRSTDLGPQV